MYYLKSLLLPATLLLLCPCFVRAQYSHPTFRQYTIENGLPSSDVYQVKQDSKGYIWFATGNGVSRFNGYTFENFSMSNGLPDNTVFEIFEDPVHRIWFLPISGKLSYYYKGKIYLYPYNDVLKKKIKKSIKMSFCVEADGTIYLGTYKDAIYRISPKGEVTADPYTYGSKRPLYVIQPDSSHLIYSLAGQAYPYAVTRFIHFNTGLIKGDVRIPDDVYSGNASTRIILSGNRHILLALNKTLYDFGSKDTFSVQTFNYNIQWLYEDHDKDLWIGTYLGGVYYVHNGDFKNKKHYLQGFAVTAIMEDHEDGFWFTTEGNGIFYTPSKNVQVFDNASGISNDKVNCLASGNNCLYAGTQNGQIYLFGDSIAGKISANISGEQTNNISCLFYDRSRRCFAVSAELNAGYIKNNIFIDDPLRYGCFHDIAVDPSIPGTYWIATSNTLVESWPDRAELLYIRPENNRRLNALLDMPGRRLLLGEIDGLWMYDIARDTQIYLGAKNSLLQNRILDLALTPDSLLVIATKGAGMLVKDGSTVYQLNTDKGFPGDNVYKVFPQADQIWAATDKGLAKVTISCRHPFKYEIESLTTADGIPSNEINDVLEFDRKIWVATNKGLAVFYPEYDFRKSITLPLYLTNIEINDSIYELQSRYELPYSQNNIRIGYYALGYKNAGQLQYRYMMEGLDTSWTYTQNREVQYTTLPPDHYSFLLSVRDADGKWSQVLRTGFIIHDPVWQRWWFRLIAVLLFILMLLLIFRYRISAVKKQEAKSSELNRAFLNLKLKALRAQMNPHFTFNVMNSIQHFILNNDNESANLYLSKFSRLIRNILNNSESNSITVEEEVITLRLYLELEVMRFENSFSYTITVDPEINPMQVKIPSMLIQPYVENAVKHGILPLMEKGVISISITKEERFLKCVIGDNGVGRAKAAENSRNRYHRAMGTSLTRERLAVINELGGSQLSEKIIDLYDKDNNPAGTRVEIYIPLY